MPIWAGRNSILRAPISRRPSRSGRSWPTVMFGRGRVDIAERRFDAAVKDYTDALGATLGRHKPLCAARRRLPSGRPATMTRSRTTARRWQKNAKYADAFIARGRAYQEQGAFRDALSDYGRGLGAFAGGPESPSARGHRAVGARPQSRRGGEFRQVRRQRRASRFRLRLEHLAREQSSQAAAAPPELKDWPGPAGQADCRNRNASRGVRRRQGRRRRCAGRRKPATPILHRRLAAPARQRSRGAASVGRGFAGLPQRNGRKRAPPRPSCNASAKSHDDGNAARGDDACGARGSVRRTGRTARRRRPHLANSGRAASARHDDDGGRHDRGSRQRQRT